MYKLNDKDFAILRALGSDSRKSFRVIARKLGIATTTVIKRYNKMKALGIIKNNTIDVDYEKLGYTLSAIIELTVSKGRLVEVEKNIAKRHNTAAVYDVTGDTDAMIVARFRDRKDMNDFVKSLLAMEFVERTNTHLILNTVKEGFII